MPFSLPFSLPSFWRTQRNDEPRQGPPEPASFPTSAVIPSPRLQLSLEQCAQPATLSTVRACLQKWDKLHTVLVVECGHGPLTQATEAQATALAQCLHGVSQGVEEFELRGTSETQPVAADVAFSMHRVALTVLPHLTSLTLVHCACNLPMPAQLSQLRKVSITLPTQPGNNGMIVYGSIARLLPQLTSLELHNCSAPAACSVFNQAVFTTTHTLTHFATDASLTGALARLLIDKAPALTDLSVREVGEDIREVMHREWGVERLTVSVFRQFPEDIVLLPKAGPCGFEVSCTSSVTCRLAFAPSQVQRTAGWQFKFPEFTVEGHTNLQDMSVHGSSLESVHTLSQLLQRIQLPPNTPVTFRNYPRDMETARALAPALAALAGELSFTAQYEGHVSTSALRAVQALGQSVQRVLVRGVGVFAQDGDSVEGVWPWKRVVVERGRHDEDKDVLGFLRMLPSPGTYTGQGKPVVEYTDLLSLTSLSSHELDIRATQELFANVQWHGPGFQVGYSRLADMLPALQCIRYESPDQHTVLDLHGMPVTPETMAMLRWLPPWRGTLVLSDCRWRLPAAEYRQLAAHIPDTYSEWVLDMKPDTELYQCICDGAKEYRASKGLPEISITAVDGATGSKVLAERRQAQAAQA